MWQMQALSLQAGSGLSRQPLRKEGKSELENSLKAGPHQYEPHDEKNKL